MPVDLTIVESTTELGQTVVEVVLEGASEPGPAGPGVAAGGTVGQVLKKQSSTDYDTDWEDESGGGGGVTDADYLVGTAHAGLSAEIVVGTTPGGELGGTWASPTVDASHSGSTHAAVQAAAEATAAAALSAHLTDTTDAHDGTAISFPPSGPILSTDVTNAIVEVANLAVLDSLYDANSVLKADSDDTPVALTMGASTILARLAAGSIKAATPAEIRALLDLEAGTDFPSQATFDDHSARHENGGGDEISIAGLDGTPTELTNHLNDSSDAHDASAISFSPTGTIAATDVQAAIAEVASEAGGGTPSITYETRSSNTILGTADKGKTIDITAAITQTFDAAATLAAGWWVDLRNAAGIGTTVVTLDPNSSENIDGATTLHMWPGEVRRVICTGSAFVTVMLAPGTLTVSTTSSVTVASNTEATPTDILSLGAQTYDAVPIKIEFWAECSQDGLVISQLFDDATYLCRWGDLRGGGSAPMYCWRELTPSAGSHTYKCTAFKNASNAAMDAGTGSGGSGTYAPMFIKATKV